MISTCVQSPHTVPFANTGAVSHGPRGKPIKPWGLLHKLPTTANHQPGGVTQLTSLYLTPGTPNGNKAVRSAYSFTKVDLRALLIFKKFTIPLHDTAHQVFPFFYEEMEKGLLPIPDKTKKKKICSSAWQRLLPKLLIFPLAMYVEELTWEISGPARPQSSTLVSPTMKRVFLSPHPEFGYSKQQSLGKTALPDGKTNSTSH